MEIYADNAATTALSPLALEAMLPFFDQTYETLQVCTTQDSAPPKRSHKHGRPSRNA